MHEMTEWYMCKQPGCSFTDLYAALVSTHYKVSHDITKSRKDVSVDCKITDTSLLMKLTEEKAKDKNTYDPSDCKIVTRKCHEINHSAVKHKKGSIFSQIDETTDDAILKIIDQDNENKILYQCPYCDISFENRKKTLLHSTAVHHMKWLKVS